MFSLFLLLITYSGINNYWITCWICKLASLRKVSVFGVNHGAGEIVMEETDSVERYALYTWQDAVWSICFWMIYSFIHYSSQSITHFWELEFFLGCTGSNTYFTQRQESMYNIYAIWFFWIFGLIFCLSPLKFKCTIKMRPFTSL